MWAIEDRLNPPHARETFYLEVMPWYYKNNPNAAGDQQMVDGTDICMPALWCPESTLIAYSKDGCDGKTWQLPPDWQGIDKVSLDRLNDGEPETVGEAEVTGGEISIALSPDEAVKITKAFRKFSKSRKAFSGLENINLHKDGHEVVLETSGIPIFDESGKHLGYRGIDRDITKRKLAEQVLAQVNVELESRIEARTADLIKTNKQLEVPGIRQILDADPGTDKNAWQCPDDHSPG